MSTRAQNSQDSSQQLWLSLLPRMSNLWDWAKASSLSGCGCRNIPGVVHCSQHLLKQMEGSIPACLFNFGTPCHVLQLASQVLTLSPIQASLKLCQ